MLVIDKTDLPGVVSFIEKQLSLYDTSRLDWIKLLPLNNRTFFHGRCTYPKRVKKGSRNFVHGYQLNCSFNVNSYKWPHSWDLAVSTWQKEIGGAKHWGYNRELVQLTNPTEAGVFIAGHEIFHFLRHSKQIPGQNTQVQADKFGLDWLKLSRLQS